MVEAMKWIFVLCFLLGLTGCVSQRAAVVPACCPEAAAVPSVESAKGSVYELDSKWEGDDGRDFRLSDLRSKPVVISMFYATCAGICVITRDDMMAVEASLSGAARTQAHFVLVSLDPKNDTASALRKYRAQNELAAARWLVGHRFWA